MTLPEAAVKYNFSPAYLRVAIHRKVLNASKVGRDWTVTHDDMLAFVSRGTDSRQKSDESIKPESEARPDVDN